MTENMRQMILIGELTCELAAETREVEESHKEALGLRTRVNLLDEHVTKVKHILEDAFTKPNGGIPVVVGKMGFIELASLARETIKQQDVMLSDLIKEVATLKEPRNPSYEQVCGYVDRAKAHLLTAVGPHFPYIDGLAELAAETIADQRKEIARLRMQLRDHGSRGEVK